MLLLRKIKKQKNVCAIKKINNIINNIKEEYVDSDLYIKYITIAYEYIEKKNIDNDEIYEYATKLAKCIKNNDIDFFDDNLNQFINIYEKYNNENNKIFYQKIISINKLFKCNFSNSVNNDICKLTNEIYRIDNSNAIKFIIINLNNYSKHTHNIEGIQKILINYANKNIFDFIYLFVTEFKHIYIDSVINPEKKCDIYFKIDNEEIKNELENKNIFGPYLSKAIDMYINLINCEKKNNIILQIISIISAYIESIYRETTL
jgi:hypothetical protein